MISIMKVVCCVRPDSSPEVSERVSEHFELRTAFRRKSSLKRENSEEGCDGRSERTPKKAGTGMLVAFEETCLV